MSRRPTADPTVEYAVSFHAAVRYRMRVEPELRTCEAKRELAARMEGRPLGAAPVWIARDTHRADGYVLLDADTAVPVREGTALTVVTRALADRLVRRRCRELGWVREAA